MEENQYELSQTKLQRALSEHFIKDDYNVFVTLTFKAADSVSYHYAQKSFGRFIHAIRCSLYKESCTYRMPLVAVVESYPGRSLCSEIPYHPNERTHIHFCIKLPGNPLDQKELVRRSWLDAGGQCGDPKVYCPNSDQWFVPIATQCEMKKYVNYSLKQCRTDHEPVLWKFARKLPTA